MNEQQKELVLAFVLEELERLNKYRKMRDNAENGLQWRIADDTIQSIKMSFIDSLEVIVNEKGN